MSLVHCNCCEKVLQHEPLPSKRRGMELVSAICFVQILKLHMHALDLSMLILFWRNQDSGRLPSLRRFCTGSSALQVLHVPPARTIKLI